MILRLVRRFFYETHLWLGIVSGLILFIVCLSGTLLVFQDEVRHIAEPSKYYVAVPEGKTALSADELIAKVEAAKPGMMVGSITIPEKPNRTVSMNLISPGQGGERGGPGGGPRSGGMERGPRGEGGERGDRGGRGVGKRSGRPGDERGNRGEGRGERGQRLEGANGPGTESERGPRGEGERWAGRNPEGRTEAGATGHEGNRDSQTEMGQGRPGNPHGGPSQRSGGGHGRGRNAVYVDPYTGDIVAEGANKVDSFFMSMMQLHRWLWFSGEWRQTGRMIVGWATVVFVIICLSGFILWLPKTWNGFKRWDIWKIGLRVRFRKGFWPFLYDTHNTIGFYMLIPALILALTGLCWSFSWYRTGAGNLLGSPVLQRGGQNRTTIEPVEETAISFSVAEMIDRQNKLTPGIGEIVVSIPQNRETPMTIQKGRTGFFALTIKDRTQWDRFRGTVIPIEHYGKTVDVERFADKPLGAQIAASVRAVHFGNITGLSSKILFFIACLFATSWPVTGMALWAKKLRAKYLKQKSVKKETEQNTTIQAASQHYPTDETTTNVGQTV